MNQLIADYIARFSIQPSRTFDTFFTQFNAQEYEQKLPYLFDIDKFCDRLKKAMDLGEKICIYSDYDTDAITATATMYWGLIELGVKSELLDFYAPDRFIEGYGMNPDAALELSKKYDLVISVDCGINSVSEAKVFKSSSCDLIITDHHQLTGEVPDCVAVINPRLSKVYTDRRQENIEYLSSSVTGVGVAWFSLVWLAYDLEKNSLNTEYASKRKNLNRLLPFVAIGTIADCQSVLEPTNRLLVRSGLSILQSGKYFNNGLSELFRQTGLQEKMMQGYRLTSQDLGYTFSPILNSSGRISHARLSISVLLSSDAQKTKSLVEELIETNNQRKLMVKDILQGVESEAQNQVDQGAGVIWLEGNWNKGIIGLLASRLVNEYDVPVVITSEEDDKVVASSRAPEGYNLPDAMKENQALYDKSGGHPGAAGFSANPKNLANIKQTLVASLTAQGGKISQQPSDNHTAMSLPAEIQKTACRKETLIIEENQLTIELLSEIMNLDPFGQDFPFPKLLFRCTIKSFRWLGIDNKHLKLSLSSGQSVTCFNIEEDIKSLFIKEANPASVSTSLWLLAKISQNTWNNKTNLDLICEKIWIAT